MRISVSIGVSWYLAARIPSRRPRTTHNTNARKTICRVRGRVCSITLVTGTNPLDGEIPRLPWSIPVT